MNYISTRNAARSVGASQAILQGISEEGGLFVPERLPRLTPEELVALGHMDYIGRAETILSHFFTDFTPAQRTSAIRAAYENNFEGGHPAALKKLPSGRYVLELFRGPTCAFKDMALQLLPGLMAHAADNVGRGGETLILTATSGDTGKAALEGFKNAPGIKIMVFYPAEGVSPMQKLQMATQEGDNVAVCAVRGNFDNTQTGVKAIFTDPVLKATLSARNIFFSSANSINWGRLLPQIVYYFSAYADLLSGGDIQPGEVVNFAVPTGNFGNILAAYYAKGMGLPLGRLICASNQNDVLAEFIATGIYNARRPFHLTLSPSMDILISSNLERLLFHLLKQDDRALSALMDDLKTDGAYQVSDEVLAALQADFFGGSCDDQRTTATIKAVFEREGYLLDPHTAVAMAVTDDYLARTGDTAKTVVVATASPYKFAEAVTEALTGRRETDAFLATEQLAALTGLPVPAPLAGLRSKAVRFTDVVDKADMASAVLRFIE
jgi:threonine synthase